LHVGPFGGAQTPDTPSATRSVEGITLRSRTAPALATQAFAPDRKRSLLEKVPLGL